MKALITGGAGFIGSHLAEALLARGDEVTIVDNLTTGSRDNVPTGATFVLDDIARDGWRAEDDWDVVFHAAASYADKADWERDARTNVTGTVNVVRTAADAGARIVYFQTSLCYGLAPASPVRIDAPLAPVGSYAVSKTAGEAYIRDSGLRWTSWRLANIYGARNLSGPPPQFYKRLSAGESCIAVDTRRDFVHVSDLVRLVLIGSDYGIDGPWHVASGTDHPIHSVYHAVARAMGIEAPEIGITPRGPDDAETILLDPYRTWDELGWRPQVTFADGIADAVAWYRANGVRRTYTHLGMKG